MSSSPRVTSQASDRPTTDLQLQQLSLQPVSSGSCRRQLGRRVVTSRRPEAVPVVPGGWELSAQLQPRLDLDTALQQLVPHA